MLLSWSGLRSLRYALTLLIIAVACPRSGKAANPQYASFSPPVLGWGTWNSFGNAFDSKVIQAEADAMVRNGMKAAGYRYVLLDEGWWLGERDAQGNIVVDKSQWPAIEPGERAGDMANIVRYLHKRGLKAGIYTDAGDYGCSYLGPDTGPPQPNTGSLNHYQRDFLQFARWGFDYVKVDWCGGDKPNLDPATQYADVARAIADAEAATGQHMTFSICDWGHQRPWTWAPAIGGLTDVEWRAGGDITDPIVADSMPKHQHLSVGTANLFRCFDDGLHTEAQHSGYYNDLDMLVIGMRGMTDALDRMHMSMWAVAGAPLLVGADLTKLSPRQLAVLTNAAVLAVDQDPLGLQGYKLDAQEGPVEWYVKPLAADGSHAVMLLNRTNKVEHVSLTAEALGLDPGTPLKVQNLWARDTGQVVQTDIVVEPLSASLLAVTGKSYPTRRIAVEALKPVDRCQSCTTSVRLRSYAAANGLKSTATTTRLTLIYRNDTARPRVIHMQVNDGMPTSVLLTAADSHSERSVAVVINSGTSDEHRILFWSEDGDPPNISAVAEEDAAPH